MAEGEVVEDLEAGDRHSGVAGVEEEVTIRVHTDTPHFDYFFFLKFILDIFV